MGNKRFEKKTASCKVYAEPSGNYKKVTVRDGKRPREVDVPLYNIYRRITK